jgi:hypothetical protein
MPGPSAAAGTVQFAQPSYTINENAGVATITVTRSGGDAGGVTVGYTTADGSAKAGVNYTPESGTLTFGAGDTSESFTIPILDDGQFNGDTTVVLTLTNPASATLGLSTSTLVIRETDSQRVLPAEGSAAPALVTVRNVAPDLSRTGVLTGITIVVSGPVDPSGAASLAHYHLAQGRRNLPLRRAVYDARALTITLKPRGRIVPTRATRLSISGLDDTLGRAVGGSPNGQPAGSVMSFVL